MNQALRFKRARSREQQRIGEAEDRKVGADAKPNRDGCHGHEQRLADETSSRVAQVLPEMRDDADVPRVATRLRRGNERAELEPSRAFRLLSRHSRGHELGNILVEMEPQLPLEIAIDRRAATERSQPQP
jgi:hypothetical protein